MDQLLDFILNFYGPTPYLIIFGVLLACGLGLPIPEDITLFVAGTLSYYGVVNLAGIMVLSYLGVMLGDSAMYWLGAKYGRKITRRWFFAKLLPEERLLDVSKRLQKRGNRLIFLARFMPGFRAPIFFSAGTLHMPYRVFFFYDGLAALLSVPLIVGTVYYFGDKLEEIIHVIQRVEHGIALSIFAVIGFFIAKWAIRKRREANAANPQKRKK